SGSSEPRGGGDRPRCAAYVVIAVAALITGFILGRLSGQDPFGARAVSPSPDSELPHPRSLRY
ncbi:MAG TPA: hypothetical protein VMG58_10380, partial [Candidatus Sulfotelmatobacter sp.]|nr:hypothetical protein [Candidatus Sulfotelmatobacter sp.]